MYEVFAVSGIAYLALLGESGNDWTRSACGFTNRPVVWASGDPTARLRSILRGVIV